MLPGIPGGGAGGGTGATLDIRTLYASQKRRDDSKRELYDTVVKRAHHRIRTVAARSETVCAFQVPPYIIGMPLYDAYQCCGYVIQRLKAEGFVVQYGHPNVLVIRWDRPSIEPHVHALNERERSHGGVRTGAATSVGGIHRTSASPAAALATLAAAPAPPPAPTAPVRTTTYVPTGRLFSD